MTNPTPDAAAALPFDPTAPGVVVEWERPPSTSTIVVRLDPNLSRAVMAEAARRDDPNPARLAADLVAEALATRATARP